MLVESPLLALEQLINRQIAASTPARAALVRLEGRAFAVAFSGAQRDLVRLRLAAAREGLRLSLGDGAADATVRGSPSNLVRLLAGRATGGSHPSGVTVDGDATVVQGFEGLFRLARPDVEAELARLVGDRSAYLATRLARRALASGGRWARALARSGGDYLVEEGRDVVGRAELGDFCASVDRLRDDVARLDARLDRLSARVRVRP